MDEEEVAEEDQASRSLLLALGALSPEDALLLDVTDTSTEDLECALALLSAAAGMLGGVAQGYVLRRVRLSESLGLRLRDGPLVNLDGFGNDEALRQLFRFNRKELADLCAGLRLAEAPEVKTRPDGTQAVVIGHTTFGVLEAPNSSTRAYT